MKFLKYLVLVFSILILFTGCEQNSNGYLKDLSFKELQNKIDNKEEFFFVVTQDGCSHCENFLPVLEKVLNEYKVVGYNLNTTNMSEDENKKFDELFDVGGTPTTIFIKDGTEVSLLQRINGETTDTKLIQRLKNNGYIKE